MNDDQLIPWLQNEIARSLDISPDQVGKDTQLLELGLDSLAAVRLCGAISEKVGFDVDPILVYDCPTIGEIVAHLHRIKA